MINISFSDFLTGSLKQAKVDNGEIRDLSENIFTLRMCLSEGNISENEFEKNCCRSLQNMYGEDYDLTFGKWFEQAKEDMLKIEKLSKSGEKVRIWYSERPDELCAFCWLLCKLDAWGIPDEQICYDKLLYAIKNCQTMENK